MQIESHPAQDRRSHAFRLGLAAAASVPAVVIVLAVPKEGADRVAPTAPRPAVAAQHGAATPSATEFAETLVGVTNQYTTDHGQHARFTRVHCVEAAPGKYMCSYAIARPNRRAECHLMQATWTPDRTSSITVRLAGRTGRCGTLRQAIATLR